VSGEGDGKKVFVPAEQNVSPFHKITIPHFSEHLAGVDSPKAVAPKIKKAAASTTGTSSGRGGRAKKSGKKNRTPETSASTSHQPGNDRSKVSAAFDDKIGNGRSGKSSSGSGKSGENNFECGRTVGGKVCGRSDLVGCESSEAGAAENEQKSSSEIHHTDGGDAAIDVDEKESGSESESHSSTRQHVNDAATVSDVEHEVPGPVTVKQRRSTSVPAGHSRYSVIKLIAL